MKKRYKKILFDLDNTLVDDDENRKYAIKQILLDRKELATIDRIKNFIDIDNQYWKDRAARKIKEPAFKNKEEKTKWVRAQRFIKYFKDISFEEAVEINNKYLKYLGEYIVPIKNSQEILKYLYQKQYEIYIVTNSPEKVIENKIGKANIKEYIKETFSAEYAGHMKPHNEFFEIFFKKMDISNKDDIILIGDEIETDIIGSINNGIDSCWFNMKKKNNNTKFKPNYEINDLIELKEIL